MYNSRLQQAPSDSHVSMGDAVYALLDSIPAVSEPLHRPLADTNYVYALTYVLIPCADYKFTNFT